MMKYDQYTNYIENAQNPSVEEFDEDWDPIGPDVRKRMELEGFIETRSNKLFVVENK